MTEGENARETWWDRRSVAGQAALTGTLVLAVFAAVFYGLAQLYLDQSRWWPWSGSGTPELYDLTRNAATITALVGGAVAIAVSLRRQRSTERTVKLSAMTTKIAEETARTAQETSRITAKAYELDQSRAQREEVDRLRDRYTTIAGQLGDGAAPVRLAGVYAMAALTDDWLKRDGEESDHEAQVCIDVLCAYIRTPRHESTDEGRLADIRVRETITRVIADHLQRSKPRTRWAGKTFDFTGAVFTGSHSFENVEFGDGCHISFAEAEFTDGCHVSFTDAEFADDCRVSFTAAQFRNGCRVSFTTAQFINGCYVLFSEAGFNDGCYVVFAGAEFDMGCYVTFNFAAFNDGCEVSFTSAKFNERCYVIFNVAVFNEGCYIDFSGAEFSTDCRVTFIAAKVNNGCHVTFASAQYNGGFPTGAWGHSPPPPVLDGKKDSTPTDSAQ